MQTEPLHAEQPGHIPGMPPAGGACPFHNDQREARTGKQKTLVLTGAGQLSSKDIGTGLAFGLGTLALGNGSGTAPANDTGEPSRTSGRRPA